MTLTLDIEHDDTVSTLSVLDPDDFGDDHVPSLQSASIERELVQQPDETDRAEVVVYRDGWREVLDKVDRTNDRFIIREDGEIIFGGRLADFEFDGVTVSVLLDGPKRDALDAEPSGGNDLFEPQPDTDILSTLLGRVSTVDEGSVETVKTDVAFSESQAAPGKSITKLARDADAEVRYRTAEDGFVLDYQARIGDDRTDETLSPSSATVQGDPRIREQITEDVTTVRVLGAGEGTAQVVAEATVSGFDPAVDRPVFRQHADKDIQQQSRAESLAETLVDEYDGSREFVEVEFEIPRDVDPTLGDEFTVELPEFAIDETLRITMLERIIDAAGDRFRAVLSNRRHTNETDGSARAQSVDEFREGNAGQIVRDSDSQGYDKVDDGEPQEWFFDYPENVIDEFEAKLRVESQPFRRPASAQGHSHGFEIDDHTHGVSISDSSTSAQNSDFETVEETDRGVSTATVGSETTLDSFTPSTSGARVVALLSYKITSDDETEIQFRLRASGSTEFTFLTNTIPSDSPVIVPITLERGASGEELELQASHATVGGSDSHDAAFSVYWRVVGTHTHGVSISDTTTTSSGGGTSSTTDSETSLQPGIVTETDLTPSNVAVDIDGETVVSGLDHPIQETVDISGVLSAGANGITTSSDTLGEVRTSITFEAIKNADSR